MGTVVVITRHTPFDGERFAVRTTQVKTEWKVRRYWVFWRVRFRSTLRITRWIGINKREPKFAESFHAPVWFAEKDKAETLAQHVREHRSDWVADWEQE